MNTEVHNYGPHYTPTHTNENISRCIRYFPQYQTFSLVAIWNYHFVKLTILHNYNEQCDIQNLRSNYFMKMTKYIGTYTNDYYMMILHHMHMTVCVFCVSLLIYFSFVQ